MLKRLFLSIPAAATAPALIIVGLLMMEPIKKVGDKQTPKTEVVKDAELEIQN